VGLGWAGPGMLRAAGRGGRPAGHRAAAIMNGSGATPAGPRGPGGRPGAFDRLCRGRCHPSVPRYRTVGRRQVGGPGPIRPKLRRRASRRPGNPTLRGRKPRFDGPAPRCSGGSAVQVQHVVGFAGRERELPDSHAGASRDVHFPVVLNDPAAPVKQPVDLMACFFFGGHGTA